jgi:hypothetical protein
MTTVVRKEKGGWRRREKKEKCMVFNSKQFAYNIYDSVKKKERERKKGEKEKKCMVFNSKQFAYNIYDLVKYASFPNIFFNYVTFLISFSATSYA